MVHFAFIMYIISSFAAIKFFWLDIPVSDHKLSGWGHKMQRCQPSLFQREAPYFCKHFYPFWCPNLATSLFLSSFVPLILHAILKISPVNIWILPIFWMLMLASLSHRSLHWNTFRKNSLSPKISACAFQGSQPPKMNSRFFTCHCHDNNRVEAVALSLSNYTCKITTFVSMWNLGQFREKLIFCQ